MIAESFFQDLSLSGALMLFMWYWFQKLDTRIDNFDKRLRRVEDKVNVYTLDEKHLNTSLI